MKGSLMGIGDKLRETVGETSRAVTDKISQKYRDHVGEELTKKQEAIEALRDELAARETAVAEREAKLEKYFLIPKIYVQTPVGIAVMVALYFGYQEVSPLFNPPAGLASSSASSSCIERGEAYYKDIGSYPRLSTGEDAGKKVADMCQRSHGAAFGH